MRKLFCIFSVILLALLSNCGSDGDLLEKANDYNQEALLFNLGNNLIVPAYEDLKDKADALNASVLALIDSPDLNKLNNARLALKEARLSFQWVAPYQFGPAEQVSLTSELNIYPVDVNQIENNITTGDYNLGTLDNLDARGFQAIAYLLYTPGSSDEEIISQISEPGYASYLSDLAERITSRAASVFSGWSAEGDNYLATFTSSVGVAAGSSVGLLVNAKNQTFERATRDGKVGIPVGIRTLGEPVIQNQEAFYAGYSVELLVESLTAYEALYEGHNYKQTNDGEGFDDYLEALASSSENDGLAEIITNQFKKIIQASSQLSNSLTDEIQNNKSTVEELFAEMQQMVIYLKTDMASTLGVVISYQDTDGD